MTPTDWHGLYGRHFSDPRRERGFLSAVGFTLAFATARAVTHSIRAGIGPFGNITAGGRHIHHSTFGILGLLGIGYLWTYQLGIGTKSPPRWIDAVAIFAGLLTMGVAGRGALAELGLLPGFARRMVQREGRQHAGESRAR